MAKFGGVFNKIAEKKASTKMAKNFGTVAKAGKSYGKMKGNSSSEQMRKSTKSFGGK